MTMTESRGVDVLAINTVFLALAWISFGLRCYARIGLLKNFGLDDLFCGAALFAFTIDASAGFAGVHYGLGQHMTELSLPEISKAMECWYYNEMAYIVTIMFVKTSICLHLRRIVLGNLLRLIDTILSTTVIFSITFVFLAAFQCSPISYFWTRFMGVTGTCIDTTIIANVAYAYTAIDILWDFTLALTPVLLVKDLQMDRKTKFSVAVLLMLGSFASIGSVIRIPYFKALTDAEDFLWVNVDVVIWSTVEIGLAIVACCLATTKPVFRTMFQWSTNASRQSNNNPNSANPSRRNTLSKMGIGGNKSAFAALDDDNHGMIGDQDIELGDRSYLKETNVAEHAGKNMSSEVKTDSPSTDEWSSSSPKSQWSTAMESNGAENGVAATSWSMIGSSHSNRGSSTRAGHAFPLTPKIMKSMEVEISRS